MKHALYGLVVIAATATVAMAAETAPTDVKFEDGAVGASLGPAGDAANGRKVFANRKLGNCLACHVNSDLAEQPFHGEVGPPLDGVADRWSEAELRGIVVNAKNLFEGTIMPAFYISEGYNRPLKDFAGTPVLTAQEVEDVVAYLMTLKEQ
ncbi:sulfur oxidation c-type cytochrome SoxX [Brevirhabdus pacifica]|uniref:Sulfur oxidation c-type cytochrome SoxX n=1 Tax=Brevirhabdus pacifica TaxID=1267768 RepID=A0A1U7DHE8_9RHOB|nr:sulfur oxidation c-type cytochrome SoxX [Brevirhabdus pacifica]APX89424.1 sulfur oxidation c-type cytochrome SoxX [Brevirhabdus pacifica]OWU76554.1 monoheme cytochrome C SoxX [Loktanella sp. 22II-4b]PJJ85933.1 monoheme cytochrome SoxX (sulfur oxidation) [Brevirhabdus pacifica]